MSHSTFLQCEIAGHPARRGKVRDVFEFGDKLLFVATDRISAFDWVLPSGIPDKGRVLTQMSAWWFSRLPVKNHLLTLGLDTLELPPDAPIAELIGRSMVVKRAEVFPVECVVRGYLSGSGWKEYQQSGTVCGIKLPPGLRESDRLPEPIFTPATKESTGHDINIPFERMCEIIGEESANKLRELSLLVYQTAAEYAGSHGVIIADTKFEFGMRNGEILLVDEVLTPDSSRFWPADQYQPGKSQPSYDKQFVRDWLETSDWDKNSSPPMLPEDVIEKTRAKYIEAYETLTGNTFDWK